MLPALAVACGFDRRIGLAAGLFGALVPLRRLTELKGWETPLTGLLWVAMALATVRWRAAARGVARFGVEGAGHRAPRSDRPHP